MNIKNKKQSIKISKGYRLKPSTHRMIKKVQRSFNVTQDKIISMALRFFVKNRD